MAYSIIVLNVKYVIIVSTLVNQLEYVLNAQRKTVCPSPHLPDVAKSVMARFALVPVSEVTCQTVYVTIQSQVTLVVSCSAVQCLITYAIYHIAVIVQNMSNQITSVLLKLKEVQCQIVEINYIVINTLVCSFLRFVSAYFLVKRFI